MTSSKLPKNGRAIEGKTPGTEPLYCIVLIAEGFLRINMFSFVLLFAIFPRFIISAGQYVILPAPRIRGNVARCDAINFQLSTLELSQVKRYDSLLRHVTEF